MVSLGLAETKNRHQAPGRAQKVGAKNFHLLPLTGPEQLKELHKVLEVWSRSPPLKPLKFEKVGVQVGLKGQLGEVVGEDQELRK